MITAESIRKTVESRIAEMVESRHEYLKHGEFLTSRGIAVRNNLTLHYCLENVFAHYLDFLCGKLSQENADGTPAKIAVDPAFYQLFTHRDQRNKSLCELFFQHWDGNLESDQALAKTYVDAIAFTDIADAINRQLSELVDTGLHLFAKKMIDLFNLSSFDGYYSPYRKSGRVICQAWSFNYHDVYKKMPELLTVGNALQRIEQNAALSFGSALNDYITAAKNLGYQCEKIPYRSVFGKGGHLEIHCYKDKHEYRFSQPGMDAILAFLMLNGEAETAEKIMTKLNIVEAA
jgi:hypothetical protein